MQDNCQALLYIFFTLFSFESIRARSPAIEMGGSGGQEPNPIPLRNANEIRVKEYRQMRRIDFLAGIHFPKSNSTSLKFLNLTCDASDYFHN